MRKYIVKLPVNSLSQFNVVVADFLSWLMRLPWLLVLAVSISWIAYRIFLVFQKPTEELEEVLGIDIPPAPDVALAKITSNSVLLYWKPPENYHSPLKHLIQVNGINVGQFERADSTIRVTGLQPGNYYGIRAAATNSSGNSSYSSLIQIQTIPQDGHRGTRLLSTAEYHAKRHSSIRRISQPAPGLEPSSPSSIGSRAEKEDSDETILKLTKRLDALKQQNEEAERLGAEENSEAEGTKEDLMEKRDELKSSVEESDKAWGDSKRQAAELEKQCKIAQRKKSAKERLVQAKKAERQKMKDEIQRWQAETRETYENAKEMRAQKERLEEAHEKNMASVQNLIDEAQSQSVQMEEELRELGKQVKVLEEERAKADQEQNEEYEEAERREKEDEQVHETRVQELQTEYAAMWKMNASWEASCRDTANRVAELLELRQQNPSAFAPIPGLDINFAPPMVSSARRPRQNNPRKSSFPFSHNPAGFTNHATFNSTSSASPTFATSFPYLGRGTKSSPANSEHATMSVRSIEHLTAGTPMSPSVDTLLPSNLLGDDEDLRAIFARNSSDTRNSNPMAPPFRPSSREYTEDPQSPLSITSKSPSLLSSPHESMSHIQSSFYGSDPLLDDGARPIPTSASPFSAPAVSRAGSSRKISGLFGLHRQRDKGAMPELPALGALKQGESQSFPLNLDGDPNLSTNGRRKGAGIWSNPMSTLLNRGTGANSGESRRGMFGSRLEPSEAFDRPISRPSSTYSFGEGLFQPSEGQQFGWQTPDSGRPRGGTMGSEWPNVGGPWSYTRSRRQSLQHGSTSNLSIGSTPIDPNDEYVSPYLMSTRTSQPAPIGTERHRISQRSNTPKLNPAAAPFTAPSASSFTSRLFTRGESKKTPRSEKSHEFGSEKSRAKETAEKSSDVDAFSKSSSPLMSRHSQDGHSIMTFESMGESHDGLEHSISATPSEPAGTPSNSTPRESLMQKITRKSSSSKFSQFPVPWGKDRSGKATSKREPSTPGEMDEDGSDYMGRSIDSSSSIPQYEKSARGSLSWSRVSSVIGKGKKRGELAPSDTSERASEAEGGDEEE